jgi:hypothetical protein
MKQTNLFFANPEIHQLRKIEEIRALSYENRIKRLFVLIEISLKIKNSKSIK